MDTRKKSQLVRFLGKLLFPGRSPWQQRANVLVVLWSVATGILVGGCLAVVLLHWTR